MDAASKAVAKSIKAKGLQRLKWYCQMCEKQCRDANGFKNHCSTEGHLQQMKLFRGASTSIIDQYTNEFVNGFMTLLQQKGSHNKCKANAIYQEYIADRRHVHMNATIFDTLTSFVNYLDQKQLVRTAQDEKGEWWLTYVDPHVEAMRNAREENIKKRKRVEQVDEERELEHLQKEIEDRKLRQQQMVAAQSEQKDSEADSTKVTIPQSEGLSQNNSNQSENLAKTAEDNALRDSMQEERERQLRNGEIKISFGLATKTPNTSLLTLGRPKKKKDTAKPLTG